MFLKKYFYCIFAQIRLDFKHLFFKDFSSCRKSRLLRFFCLFFFLKNLFFFFLLKHMFCEKKILINIYPLKQGD